MNKVFFLLFTIIVFWSCSQEKKTNYKHVIVIGFDGLSPDGLLKAHTPFIDSIRSQGSYSLHARAVLPSSSSTNWASMIMGVGPEQHGITSNDWERDNFILPTVTEGEEFLFPTIFKIINDNKKNAEIGAIYHWSGFGRLFEKNVVDYNINPKTEDSTAVVAAQYIKNKKPDFTFIHFDHIDHAGHEYGFQSKGYYESVEKADGFVKQIFKAIHEAGMEDNTLVLIVSDHGGIGNGHGGETLEEMQVPFILWGKTVKKGYQLEYPVYQYDNAPTVAYALGINPINAWIGKNVKEAFNIKMENDPYKVKAYLQRPTIYSIADSSNYNGGLFIDSVQVTVNNPNEKGNIHFTTDGHLPSSKSLLYEKPITIKKNTSIKAAIFLNDKLMSNIDEKFYRIRTAEEKPKVHYEIYYLDSLKILPDFKKHNPQIKGMAYEIGKQEIQKLIKDNTAIRFTTKLVIEKEGEYKFYLRSDDGSKMFINNKLLVDNDGDHGVKEKSSSVFLPKGIHQIEVQWFNGYGGSWLDVFYQNDTIPKQIFSTDLLSL